LLRERPHDVRADVSRASGDQPAHVPASRTREFRTLTPMVSGRRARGAGAAGRPWSDGAGRQVLGVPVAVPDLGATVAVGVEAQHRGEDAPDGEARNDEEDYGGHGSKCTPCDILPIVAEWPLIDLFLPFGGSPCSRPSPASPSRRWRRSNSA